MHDFNSEYFILLDLDSKKQIAHLENKPEFLYIKELSIVLWKCDNEMAILKIGKLIKIIKYWKDIKNNYFDYRIITFLL